MQNPPSGPPRLTASASALVVVDVQEKLLPTIPNGERLVADIAFLLDAANLLGVPVLATEQYPQGLGPTVSELAGRLTEPPAAKRDFSCCGAAAFTGPLATLGRPQVVLAGMEAHVCILQSALDLLAMGFQIFVPADGVSSRSATDHEVALRRLEAAGAVLTTCETTVFEWTGSSEHPKFKDISRLVRQRFGANA